MILVASSTRCVIRHTNSTSLKFLVAFAMLLSLGACTTPTPVPLPTATQPAQVTPSLVATPIPTSIQPAPPISTPIAVSPSVTAIHADIILTESQVQQPTTVKVGQIINVQVSASAQWTVNYRDLVLQALTPPEKMKQPGASGWFFRALAPGNTEIALESVPPTCPPGTVCPPAIIRFVFPIQVTP